MYQPNPIDTGDVELSPELLELTEKIAEQVHEVWAQGRIHTGWTYAEHRDDAARTTPCLVPYAELSEEEKSFDRETALGTLRFLIKLGYTITKQPE